MLTVADRSGKLSVEPWQFLQRRMSEITADERVKSQRSLPKVFSDTALPSAYRSEGKNRFQTDSYRSP